MGLDPITALAFALQAAPGVYALLIGSGVSSAAGIPTGWDIMVDLIRRIAVVEGADAAAEPERWYAERFGAPPLYSDLLDKLARTSAERQQILRAYIEPSDDDRRAGLRLPTKAHHAIAELVARRSVRVIITTNFDRLIELALDEHGLSYDVIDGVDALKGARPFVHSPCTVIKVHGDYRDARIRNTPYELDHYEPDMDAFLDQVLDAHGLVVCGWSATWDTALRAALERQANRRYTIYWSTRGELTQEARDLIAKRRADQIAGYDADSLFTKLESMVAALAEADRPHPLSVATAVAELKRCLPDPQASIRLEDLVLGTVERAIEATPLAEFPSNGAGTTEELRSRILRYHSAVDIFIALATVGCSHSSGASQDRLWSRAIARLAEVPEVEGGLVSFIQMRRYPALLGLYAGGLAAVASENWPTLRELFLGRTVTTPRDSGDIPLVGVLCPDLVLQSFTLDPVLNPDWKGPGSLKRSISDHLGKVLREPLKVVVPSDATYREIFDRFEFLLGATLFDIHEHRAGEGFVRPGYLGSFAYRPGFENPRGAARWATDELAEQGADWPVLRAGLFDGDAARADAAIKAVIELIRRSGYWF